MYGITGLRSDSRNGAPVHRQRKRLENPEINAMSIQTSRSHSSLTAMLLLFVAGCGSSDAAKLTGRYSLESATSAQWTNGATLTPPTITGVLLLDQSRFGIDGALGLPRWN